VRTDPLVSIWGFRCSTYLFCIFRRCGVDDPEGKRNMGTRRLLVRMGSREFCNWPDEGVDSPPIHTSDVVSRLCSGSFGKPFLGLCGHADCGGALAYELAIRKRSSLFRLDYNG